MFKNLSTHIFLSCIGLFLLLIGCQPTIGQGIEAVPVTRVVVSEDETNSLTTVTVAPTRPLSQMAIATGTAPSSPTVSPTSPPTLTPMPTETATPTPRPTLLPDEAANKVLSLLTDNQNPDCLLPCWWGTIPGQTYWRDSEVLLSALAKNIRYSFSGDIALAEVLLPLPESVSASNSMGYRLFYQWNKSGIIQQIRADAVNILGYDPKTMMTLYGLPDEVWLKTLDAPREGILPFQLIIIYQEQGISFHYYVNATSTYETVTACFEPGVIELERPDLFPVGPRIRAWVPGQYRTIDEIANIPDEHYFPLAEMTDLTVQTFYEKFTDPNEAPCTDTPAQLWWFQ